MRAFATLIGMLLLLSSCGVVPGSQAQNRAELDKIKGPETGSIESTLKEQAEQAANAGDFTRAVQTYRQLTDKAPDNMDYQLALADSLRRAGEFSGAIGATVPILKKDPHNAGALECKGLS